MTALPAPRARCYRCLRPAAMCLCADVTPLATRTQLVVLQHPRERLHPFGTARLVRLLMPAARIVVPTPAWDGRVHCAVDVPADAALLFPHPQAQELSALAADEQPRTLVVLDGTWAHAKRLYRDNPWLHDLRHVRLTPAAPSNYRIRKEPRPEYVSTIEAIVAALRILEPEHQGLEAPLRLFDRMVDRQIECLRTVARHGRKKRKRQRPSRRLSPLLAAGALVLVHAETALLATAAGEQRLLVQWSAVRVRDGATFDAVLRADSMRPLPAQLAPMQLEPASLDAGEARAAAVARFRAFAGDAPLAAWARSALGHRDFVGERATTVLKSDYCNLRNAASGRLDDVVQREGLVPVAVACRGRARQRLGNAMALVHWLRAAGNSAAASTVMSR